jgi:uncharacterized protein (DUF2267 family)
LAQLPELLRGIYYEHRRPIVTPANERHMADFMARVDKAFKADPILFTSEGVTAVLELLSEKLTAGEIEHVRYALPPISERFGHFPRRADGVGVQT